MDKVNGIRLIELSKGNKGQEVRVLQTLLNAVGYDCGTVDGIFGTKTEKAVLAYTNYKSNKVDIDFWYKLFNDV